MQMRYLRMRKCNNYIKPDCKNTNNEYSKYSKCENATIENAKLRKCDNVAIRKIQ